MGRYRTVRAILLRMTTDPVTPEHRPVVVAPTYDNAGMLRDVLDVVRHDVTGARLPL